MQVGIVGGGVVGLAMKVMCPDATVFDPNKEEFSRNQWAVNECDISFICVPTPMSSDGSCDTSIVEETVKWLKTPLIVIRSTVAPGTTERLCEKYNKQIIFQPEYLGETVAHPMRDVISRSFVVLGGESRSCAIAVDFYRSIYNSSVRFYFTSSKIAEVAKYMENAFFAAKVAFVNEMFDIAAAHDVDYDELREIWLSDPRVERTHTFVYPNNRGFGGKCLPKDMNAIVASSEKNGYTPRLLKAVLECNERFVALNKSS